MNKSNNTAKKVRFTAFLAVMMLLLSLVGCTKAGREADLSDSVNLACSNQWCVVSVPYAAFKKEPSDTADVVNHGRRSDIYEISGKKYITQKNETVIWYQFEKGWLPESSVLVYENLLKARTAAESMHE